MTAGSFYEKLVTDTLSYETCCPYGYMQKVMNWLPAVKKKEVNLQANLFC
jgi:hypothetical protein